MRSNRILPSSISNWLTPRGDSIVDKSEKKIDHPAYSSHINPGLANFTVAAVGSVKVGKLRSSERKQQLLHGGRDAIARDPSYTGTR